jgi:ABC-type nitrate/sulfonate/bicarbonate transport system substrate-binding protein
MQKKSILRFVLSGATLIVAGALAACAPAATAPAAAATKVKVQLSWLHNVEFAGFYMAQSKGLYAKENLVADLGEGGYDSGGNYIDPQAEVLSGKADFGISDGGGLLAARAKGKPLVAIATIFQRQPMSITSLAEKKLTRPQDLIGKKVMVSSVSMVPYLAMLKSQKVDPASINTIPRTDFTTAPLISGEADAVDGWIITENLDLQSQGHAINTILVSDYGIEMYPDVIFTTEDTVKNKPDLVLKFLRATLAGYQAETNDPVTTTDVGLTYTKDITKDLFTKSIELSLPLVKPAGSQPGMMTDNAWKITKEIMVEQNLLDAGFDLAKAYTLDFLNKVYAK